jgi:Flp pilus assembly pilin Flp
MAVEVARHAGQAVRAWWSEENGQGVVEYGLILVGSALFALVLLVFFGGTLSAVLEAIGQAIERAS